MPKRNKHTFIRKMKTIFHLFIFLIGFISVILHIIYSPNPLASTTKFTIHANLIVSFSFLISFITSFSKKDEFPFLDFLKNCSIIYMSVGILTYHFLLASGGEYSGVRIITNYTLHYLIPMLTFFNWIVFETKKRYKYISILTWIIYPVLYCFVSLLRGAFDGFYPYFFLNPNGKLPVGVGNYGNVTLFIISFTVVFIMLGLILVTLNRLYLYFKNKYYIHLNQDKNRVV
ncbi:Pr6Pr family membrane protein [Metabacillus malikii]|uniref:Pr6Pr family membrane protein n=1 Tax=Metabacillus malikii TaxID=1504265 RepID=A0ABT9ZH81_9BACI|nr:Pr6Pr family membrane protein [Metabacillus malikii]MDQ0231640.1 hypothetical protein [Metabacillus malikii]